MRRKKATIEETNVLCVYLEHKTDVIIIKTLITSEKIVKNITKWKKAEKEKNVYRNDMNLNYYRTCNCI